MRQRANKFITGLVRSFRAAGRGVQIALKEERTFRVMAACALLVVAAICLLPLAKSERVILLLVTGSVLVLELLNTAIERFTDLVKPRLSLYVMDVKDLMAAAVLLASGIAAAIAGVIIGPHLISIFMSL